MLLTHPDLPKKTFQFTFPARGTTRDAEIKAEDAEISIHVPREGNDAVNSAAPDCSKISIHVPREGNDPVFRISSDFPRNISIHVPREGNDLSYEAVSRDMSISIHVPREGNDTGR